MLAYGFKERQKADVAWPVNGRWTNDSERHAAALSDFQFTSKLAFAVIRNGSRWCLLAGRVLGRSRPRNGETGNVEESADASGLSVQSFHNVACAQVVDFVKLRTP